MRLPDESLNLHRTGGHHGPSTEQERRIQLVFPELMTAAAVARLGACEQRNRVIFSSSLQLNQADHETVYILSQIQDRLAEALVPYATWPTRVSTLLSGDFQSVRNFIQVDPHSTWLDLVEGVLLAVHKSGSLNAPLINFIGLLPMRAEAYLKQETT